MKYNTLLKAIKIKFMEAAIDTLANNIYKNFIKNHNSISLKNLKVGMHFKEITQSNGLRYEQCKITAIRNIKKHIMEITFDFRRGIISNHPGFLLENAYDRIYIHTVNDTNKWEFIE